jgi:hypothetical protein
MSEDIQFKITADESGALNAFKRVRNEVLNNEQGLKEVGKQGKLTSMALKDAASVLGPQFQILGDRIDHISGALGDVKGASLLAKASIVGLVAVGSWEVGRMVSDWITGAEEWAKANEEAVKRITASQDFLIKKGQERLALDLQIANLAASPEQRQAELTDLLIKKKTDLFDAQQALIDAEWDMQTAKGNNALGMGGEDDAIAEANLANAREMVKVINEQINAINRQRDGATGREAELERRKAEKDAIKAETDAIAKQTAEQDRHNQTQADYLANLDLELIKLKEGEEAYERKRLKMLDYSDETIEKALKMKAEITEINELNKIRADEVARPELEERDSPIRIGQRGDLQGTQQRFITRGIGMKGDEKLLAAAKEQAQRAAEMLKEAKKQTAFLAKIPKGVTE